MALALIYSFRPLIQVDDEDSITISTLVEIVKECSLINHWLSKGLYI